MYLCFYNMKILAIGDFHGKFPEKLKKKIKKEKIDLILANGDYTGIDEWRPLIKKMFKAREKGKELTAEEIIGKKRYKKLLKKDYAAGKKPIKELNKFKIRIFSVFGNGDWYKVSFNDVGKFYEKLIKKLKYIKSINRGKAKFKQLKIVGFGGYLDSDVYFTEKGKKAIADNDKISKKRKKRYDKEEKRLMKLMKFKPDILLTHYPPYKCLDKMKAKGYMLTGNNMGISLYNRAIKKFKPKLAICGHMHEAQGKCKIGKTIVVNTGAACDGKAAVIEFDEKKRKVERVRFVR